VLFKTTNGSFVRGANTQETTQTAGADGVAVVPLYASSSLGSAVVTVIAAGFSATQTVNFVPAAPDFITLRATPLEVSKANETNATTVNATLSRSIGTVTANTRVDFSIANDASGESFGRFEAITRSNADGEVTAQFVPGTAAPLGLATITARVPETSLVARVKINIAP
jgi:hypothetical protein